MPITPPLQFTCQDGQPLLKLEANGQPPILNYSLPQDTSFTTYGNVSMNLPDTFFNDAAKLSPVLPPREGATPASYVASDFLITYQGVQKPAAWGVEVLDSTTMSTLRTQANQLRQQRTGRGLPKDVVGIGEEMTIAEAWAEVLEDYLEGYNPTQIASQRNLGYPIVIVARNGIGKRITYGTIPNTGGTTPQATGKPQLYIIEEYITKSYARDYGAGKTLQIHSLFPGEKTTISIKTFKENKILKARSENVIDSFSQESATEMENLLESESSKSTNKTRSGSINFTGKIFGGSGGGNASASNTRTSNTRNLSKALSKSVDKSNSSRQITINTSTQETNTESEEVATVRQFENVNIGKVLNLAFRELLQQYVILIYLNDIKIGFSNGHADMDKLYSIEELDELLQLYVKPEHHQHIKDRLLYEYGDTNPERGLQNEWGSGNQNVPKTDSIRKPLIVKVPYTPFGATVATSYLAKNKILESTYDHNATVKYKVPGIILNVQDYTLRTPAVVVDAFLGHGDALDCEAREMQAQAVIAKQLENQKMKLILDTMSEITNPTERLRLITEFFNPAPKEVVKETVSNSSNRDNTERVEREITKG